MPWTVEGVVVADEHGWTAQSRGLVYYLKRGSRTGGRNNSGPVGWKAKPGPAFHRAYADMARAHRLKKHNVGA